MGELYDQFIARTDLTMHKWHHYFPVYEKSFERYRGKAPKMLEIGVQNGGSSRLFADWLGEGTQITGVDIDPACAQHSIPGKIDILIGDQADVGFLEKLVAEHGPWDIILDDGGHTNNQIITSFQQLFPKLNDGGTYLIEDTHAHWMGEEFRDHPRGLSVVSLVAELFDNMHRWSGDKDKYRRWHVPPGLRGAPAPAPYLTRHVGAVHLYDSIIVVEKARREEPFTELRRAGVARESDYRLKGM
jgi:23S rRNA U2552 (ribose-2'-O)-methylase RlmE/FtsJ